MSPGQAGITALPQDVFLELFKELDIVNLMSVLATCRFICELHLQRNLWLEAIARIKSVQMQLLALSDAEDLRTLSLHQLQDIVRRANRLINNLRSDMPHPVLIRTFKIRSSGLKLTAGICCLTGTNIAVSYTLGSVSSWD
ncbi:hypothetical protein C8R44DRAFT_892258 [Mycena epipterygia]|nr:hypothetical protein C8R44DRAFT_892258 [Mycena epipterygia]